MPRLHPVGRTGTGTTVNGEARSLDWAGLCAATAEGRRIELLTLSATW
jgi:hypothetical protein